MGRTPTSPCRRSRLVVGVPSVTLASQHPIEDCVTIAVFVPPRTTSEALGSHPTFAELDLESWVRHWNPRLDSRELELVKGPLEHGPHDLPPGFAELPIPEDHVEIRTKSGGDVCQVYQADRSFAHNLDKPRIGCEQVVAEQVQVLPRPGQLGVAHQQLPHHPLRGED